MLRTRKPMTPDSPCQQRDSGSNTSNLIGGIIASRNRVMTTFSRKYGDLRTISAKTSGRCHLCGDDAPLEDYGLVDLLGRDAVTVDHLEPQAFGGDHDPSNLRLAHWGCNSSRGVRPAEDVRRELMGQSWAPMSSGGRAATTALSAAVGGMVAGNVFAKEELVGGVRVRRFNNEAAAAGTLAVGLLAFFLT